MFSFDDHYTLNSVATLIGKTVQLYQSKKNEKLKKGKINDASKDYADLPLLVVAGNKLDLLDENNPKTISKDDIKNFLVSFNRYSHQNFPCKLKFSAEKDILF